MGTDPDIRVVAQCSFIEEALEALGRHHIDLVLLDYDLGNRETGLQFIRRARDGGYSQRIFLVTAGMNDADYVRALGLGRMVKIPVGPAERASPDRAQAYHRRLS